MADALGSRAMIKSAKWREMKEAGVEVRAALPFNNLIMDGVITLIGSTNMDLRSFDLNYENDILFRDPNLTGDVKRRQEDYMAQSDQVVLEDVLNWSPFRRLWNNSIATVGPVL